MKQITVIILAITLSMGMNAQEKEAPKQKEVGITFSSFENFGFTYKTGNSNSLWRLTSLLVSGENSNKIQDNLINSTKNNIGLSIGFGKEYRKEITENLEMRFGADLTFYYGYSNDKITEYKTKNYRPGIHLVFGLNYVFNNNIIMGAEILPGVSYTTTKITNPSDSDINYTNLSYGLSNKSVLLSLAYRF